jgi:hypothetical protein
MKFWLATIAVSILALSGCAQGLSEQEIRSIVREEVSKVAQGPQGEQGPRGATGAQGPSGSATLSTRDTNRLSDIETCLEDVERELKGHDHSFSVRDSHTHWVYSGLTDSASISATGSTSSPFVFLSGC